ncbi:hypothetical protein CVT24_007560 [Panaeolus cyanescens]|uniref:DUF6533 domain-containing protein n=1 Tax=Panaeolus cyanescens TaxID=181874 RepID=A0A409VR83_9AGAR|nr:hypothetical protein CVT24_007560 [Panaeolus cyanescens]
MVSLIDYVLTGLWHVQVTRYAQLGSSVIIVFDHILTFGDEIELIWQSPWSLGKALFILNRYYCLAAVIFNNYGFFSTTLTDSVIVSIYIRDALHYLTSDDPPRSLFAPMNVMYSCQRFFDWQGWTGLIACMLAEGILQMRLYALYSLNKKVLAVMLSTFVVSTAVAAWIMHSALSTIKATATPLLGGAGMFCVPSNVPKNFYTFWIPMLAFECLLCVLALIRGFQTFRSGGSLFQSGRKLVGVLIRDSIFYFLIICATYLTCLLVWIAAPVTLLEVPIGFSLAMSCVLSNRIVLNVRQVSQEINASKISSHKHVSIRMAEVSTTGGDSFCTPNSRSPWSLGKVLFFANRYYCLAATIFNNYGVDYIIFRYVRRRTSNAFRSLLRLFFPCAYQLCKEFFLWQGWTGLIACMLAEGILQMRLYALYSLNKKVLAVMVIGFAASVITSSWVLHSVLDNIVGNSVPLGSSAREIVDVIPSPATAVSIPNGKFCVPSSVSHSFYTFWIPMLAYECLLCTLALYRGLQTFRSQGSLFQNGRQLIGILIRDSVLYFLVITATYLTCLVIWVTQPSSLLEVPIGFTVAMSCVLANRTMFNVRQVSRTINTHVSQASMSRRTADRGGTVDADNTVYSQGVLDTYDLNKLRTLRAERPATYGMVRGFAAPESRRPMPTAAGRTSIIIIE